MKKILFCLIVFFLGLSANAQLSLLSKSISLNEYNSVKKKFIETSSRETDNYITWKDGRLTIICQDCKTTKFVYSITEKRKTDWVDDDFYTVSYDALQIPKGDEVTILVGYNGDGVILNISIVTGNFMVIYDKLVDY